VVERKKEEKVLPPVCDRGEDTQRRRKKKKKEKGRGKCLSCASVVPTDLEKKGGAREARIPQERKNNSWPLKSWGGGIAIGEEEKRREEEKDRKIDVALFVPKRTKKEMDVQRVGGGKM